MNKTTRLEKRVDFTLYVLPHGQTMRKIIKGEHAYLCTKGIKAMMRERLIAVASWR
jgi:hypothetical protein